MNSTRNKKIEQVKETTMIVGIDVGSEKHYFRAFNWRGIELTRKPVPFSNSMEGFDCFYNTVMELMQNNKLEEAMVGMEVTPMAELRIINMDEVAVEEVEWLWYPYISFGKLTIVHGDGGEGKTTLILQLAALLSRGEKLPCDDTEREPIKVIYQTAEDGFGDTIKPRLLSGNADCAQIKVIDESEAALTMLDERVEQAIAEMGARVIILDPMQAYIGAKVDMNRANEVRNILSQLGRIAEKYRCAIILVGPLNKAQGNKSTYRGLGSIDFQATARSVLVVSRVKDKPEIRVAAHQKSSLAPEGKPIAFELSEANGFRWLGHYDISIDDLLSGVSREKKSDIAERLITECLSEGKYPQQTLLQKAQNLGISKRVLDGAKKNMNVRSVKEGSQWYWKLPEEKTTCSL